MKVYDLRDAYDKGLLVRGCRVRSDATDHTSLYQSYTGEFIYFAGETFFIRRDDGVWGDGRDGEWAVSIKNTKAFIEILPNEATTVLYNDAGWIDEVELVDEEAAKFLRTYDKISKDSVSLLRSFGWISSPQGMAYWEGVHNKILEFRQARGKVEVTFGKGDVVKVVKHGDCTMMDCIVLGDDLLVTHVNTCAGKETRLSVGHTHTHEVSCFELVKKGRHGEHATLDHSGSVLDRKWHQWWENKNKTIKEESDIMEATSTNVNDTIVTVCTEKKKSIKNMMLINKFYGKEIGGDLQDELHLGDKIDVYIDRAQKKQDEIDKKNK